MTRYALLMALCMATNACAIVNYYDSHYGKVIDATTNAPIQGAVVLAVYNTSGLDHTERVDAVEVVTNEKGYFKIPSRLLFTFRFLGSWDPYPQIFIFKPEYGCFPKFKKERVIQDIDGTDIRAAKGSVYSFVAPHERVPGYSLPSQTALTIMLEKLTLDERKRYYDCVTDGGVPDEKKKELMKLQKLERANLGFDRH